MGFFLATQIHPGATVYNLRVQLLQGLWGFRPLFTWFLMSKIVIVGGKSSGTKFDKGGRLKIQFHMKIWSIWEKKL